MTKRNLTFLPKGLVLTDAKFDGLHQIIDKARSNAVVLKIPREDIVALLNDYSLLLNAFDGLERVLRSPEPQRGTKDHARSVDEEDPIG